MSEVINEYENIFNEIYGHDNIKKIFLRSIVSRKPVHILLTGSRGSGKSLFLEAIKKHLPNVYYADNNTTGPGMIEYLSTHPSIKYFCIDEIDKLDHSEQNVLLNVMESGILRSTKVRKTFEMEMNLWIFATANNVERLAREMRSRFLIFHFKDFAYHNFLQTSQKLLMERFGYPMEFCWVIADQVWKKMKSNDIRDVIKIATIASTPKDLDWVIETMESYSEGE